MAGKAIKLSASDAEILKGIAGEEVDDSVISAAEMTSSILGRILGADTLEDVDAAAGPFSAEPTRDVAGQVFVIRNVSFLPTGFKDDRDEGAPLVYAVMDCVDEDGVERSIRTSSASTMAQLFQYRRLGAFPVKRRIAQSEHQTAAGFRPIWLEPV
jgi:hypothetical protein